MCSKSHPTGTLLGRLWPQNPHQISHRSLSGIPERIDAIFNDPQMEKSLKMTSKMVGLFLTNWCLFWFCDSLPSQMGPGRPQTLKNQKQTSKMMSSFNIFFSDFGQLSLRLLGCMPALLRVLWGAAMTRRRRLQYSYVPRLATSNNLIAQPKG